MKSLAIIIVFILQSRCLFNLICYRFLFKLAGKSNKYQSSEGRKTTQQERELHAVECQALLNFETWLNERARLKEIN